MIKHNCKRWTFHAGMATCEHGFELLPNGDVRKPTVAKWASHRDAIEAQQRRKRR